MFIDWSEGLEISDKAVAVTFMSLELGVLREKFDLTGVSTSFKTGAATEIGLAGVKINVAVHRSRTSIIENKAHMYNALGTLFYNRAAIANSSTVLAAQSARLNSQNLKVAAIESTINTTDTAISDTGKAVTDLTTAISDTDNTLNSAEIALATGTTAGVYSDAALLVMKGI